MAEIARKVHADTIAHRLEDVRERIERACQRAGRNSRGVTLIGVTKNFPLDAVLAARDAGLYHFGENRVQELVEKAEGLPGQQHGGTVSWHMIGHLQRNKAKDIVEHADVFHALDSSRLAAELNRRAGDAGRVLPCLVQVNVSGEASKFGLEPGETRTFLDDVAHLEHVRVEGLMTIASYADDPEDVRPEFQTLRALLEDGAIFAEAHGHSRLLSMGMSNDFEVAIEEGATHIRIGSAIFGPRQ